MGCWNETCMISHLPILGGEECAAVILLDQGRAYSNRYVPMAIVHGEYDEYGRLENCAKREMGALLFALPKLNPKGVEDFEYRNYHLSSEMDFFAAIRSGLYIPRQNGLDPLLLQAVFLKKLMISFAKASRREISVLDKAFAGNSFCALSGIAELSPCRPVNHVIGPFQKALIDFDKETAHENFLTLFALNRLISNLRMEWHIPSGSQKGLTEEMVAFSGAYREELQALNNQLNN